MRVRRGLDWVTSGLRLRFWQAIRRTDDPAYFARGFSVGIFVSAYPLSLLHFPLALGLAFVGRGSKIAAMAGAMVTNPITMGPVYALTYSVGRALVPFARRAAAPDLPWWAALGWWDLFALFVGSSVVGLLASAISYYVVRAWAAKIITVRHRRRQRRLERMRQRAEEQLP